MPLSGPLKAVPHQNLCLFCAFRLLSRPPNPRSLSHATRWISSSRQTSQFAGAAASRKIDDEEGESLFTRVANSTISRGPSNSKAAAAAGKWHNRTANGRRGHAGRPEQNYRNKPQFRVQVQDRESLDSRQTDSPFNSEVSSGWKWRGVRRVQSSSQYSPTADADRETETPNIRRLQPSDGTFVSFRASASRTCYICKEQGHTADQCPQRNTKIRWTASTRRIQPRSEEFPLQRPPRKHREAQNLTPEPTIVDTMSVGSVPLRPEEMQRRGRRLQNRASRWEDEIQEERRGRDRNRERNGNRRSDRDEDYDDDVDYERIEAKRQRKLERQRLKAAEAAAQAKEAAMQVALPEHISVANLAVLLKIRGETLAKKMESMGYSDVAYDHVLNAENASLIAMELGFEPTSQSQSQSRAEDEDLRAAPLPDDFSTLPPRPPVVTIMGHVDHGKTTLLDYLRKSSIAAGEHGGITQHIGAFVVALPHHSGKTITFLDTPGHAAFLTMRQRGATVTDIVVLVVAADDSVMPQTLEAIAHARAAAVPLVVAINKTDLPDADSSRVKADLARHGVEVEDYGGDVQAVEVSGKTGKGMRALEEAVVTLSEMLEKRAPVDGVVEGWVLEASTKRSGRAATVLVRRGTLRVGDVIVAGTAWARVRTLRNEFGTAVEEASPGTPVEVDGWRGEPGAGDEVLQAASEDKACDVVKYRESIVERKKLSDDMEAINAIRKIKQEHRHRQEAAERAKKLGGWDVYEEEDANATEENASTGITEVPFIVKADVAGSAEAVVNCISAIGNNEVRAKLLRSGVGAVSEFDVEHASVAEGHIIAFNTRVDPAILQMAAREGVRIVDQSIIYRVVEQVTDMLSEKLPDKIIQSVTGEAEIAQLFSISLSGRKKMQIAGCKVRNGVIRLGSKVRMMRSGKTIYDGSVSSLKSVKKDVAEMRKDTECGMAFSEWEDFQVGDRVQCYEESAEKRTLRAAN